MAKLERVEKLLKMREWIDENFHKYHKPYEKEFIKHAQSLDLDPFTIKAVKREMELRFSLNHTEWQIMHILLHFSAMRQAGINSKVMGNKKIDVEIRGARENDILIERMKLLMWDVIAK